MSKALATLKYIDEKITNKLTDLCWWINRHFEKDTMWVINFFGTIFYPIIITIPFFLLCWGKDEEGLIVFLGSMFIGASGVLFIFILSRIKKIPEMKEYFENLKISPNKNRTSLIFYFAKIVFPLVFFIVHFVTDNIVSGMDPAYSVFMSFVILFESETIIYLMCVDPPPPLKRKAFVEEGNVVLIPVNK